MPTIPSVSRSTVLVAAGVIGLSVLVVGIGAFLLSRRPTPVGVPDAASTFIAPVSAHPSSESLTIAENKELQTRVTESVKAAQARGDITTAGIYFRDLNDGPTLSINGDALFSPASLLKLPLAMWFYKEAQVKPDLLSQQIEFTGPKGTSIEHFPGPQTVTVGTTYSIEELITLMLEQSDNDASSVLASIAGIPQTDQLYKDLGLMQVQNYQTYVISVRDYASFFRVLFNGTYIGRASSEHILELLNHSSFTEGLVAGVPAAVPVAHKFGERVIAPDTRLYQLHDCGVVYVPEHPYILCVMTQGHDYDVLAAYIASVSKTVYTAVIAR